MQEVGSRLLPAGSGTGPGQNGAKRVHGMCWSSGPMVTSSLFLHAGLAIYWITFGLVSSAAAVKLGLGFVKPSNGRGGGGGMHSACI